MAVLVRIPAPLRRMTKGQDKVEVECTDVRECIEALDRNYSGMKQRVCDENGQIRAFVNLYRNGEDVRFLQGLDTPLKPGDEVSIVPAVAGGA